ncbi:uncharacterized protein FFB20_03440 [Fusarium fujikuroi]|uniref:Uncharacterized protein n=1 Tax=Fusarium fujikuroi TaxID=5127 RepID=A0A2H3SPR5_FUSFU|nr:uncharacterized protein FFB20_03440 [Fusarium fujikuroi]SCO11849.1 uncharacterized protein FFE2_12443 [Fusarium fujikuroi]SCO20240.1 uncharacterized protein FFM5_12335 [Fusarium fujikuroi]SCO23004.1 uncharacterized protein FFC1_14599 [Fusarium fujikuroi]SCO50554.1 uncharacterized protein FFNC_13130 [Fusarium fujikuroi]
MSTTKRYNQTFRRLSKALENPLCSHGVIALVNDAFASHEIKFGFIRGAHLEIVIFLLCYGIKATTTTKL